MVCGITREITRLYIMAYLDTPFNLGSKQEMLSASDKLQTFRAIFDQKLFTWDNTFCFVLKGNLMHEKSQNLTGKKETHQWFDWKCPELMAEWLYST